MMSFKIFLRSFLFLSLFFTVQSFACESPNNLRTYSGFSIKQWNDADQIIQIKDSAKCSRWKPVKVPNAEMFEELKSKAGIYGDFIVDIAHATESYIGHLHSYNLDNSDRVPYLYFV